MILVLLACVALQSTTNDAPPARSVTTIELGAEGVLAVRDLDGDGDRDLVHVRSDGFVARRFVDGAWEKAGPLLPWPGENVAWDVVDADENGVSEIVVFADGLVQAWRPDAEAGWTARTIAVAVGDVPRGIFRMNLLRDVNGDGLRDLVLPAFGHFDVRLRRAGADFDAPVRVALDAHIHHDVGDPRSLNSTFGQVVSVPWFSIEDADGDGAVDLVATTEREVAFHLATPGPSPSIASEPMWTLDLEGLRAELPELGGLQLNDLFIHGGQRVAWRLADLDGEGPRDLVVQIGSKLRIYAGGARTGAGSEPTQVLLSSGNVLFFLLRDVLGDGRPDLQLIRGEGLSLGRILRWLVLPGSLDLELYTYENRGGRFSSKPVRRNELVIRIPRLLSFADEFEGLAETLEAESDIPAVRVAFGADAVANDVVDVLDGRLVVALDCAVDVAQSLLNETRPDDVDELEILERLILADLDRLGPGGRKTLDLGEIDTWNVFPGALLRRAAHGAPLGLDQPLPAPLDEPRIFVRDLDGDGRPDFLVLAQDADEGHAVHLVLSPADS